MMLSDALDEARAVGHRVSADEKRYTVNGKKGVWRTSDAGHDIFFPDDGSEPTMNPHVKKAWKARSGAEGGKAKAAGAGATDGGGKATASNWKDKLKAIAKSVGAQFMHPIHAARDLIKKPEARAKLKEHIKKSIKKEVAETGHLLTTLGRAMQGEKVSAEDRSKAIHQAADLVKTALVVGIVGKFAAGGLGNAAIASVLDDVVALAIDKPLRLVTAKVFGQAHGLLPSAFYEGTTNANELLDKIVDAILDELAGAGDASENSEQLRDALLAS